MGNKVNAIAIRNIMKFSPLEALEGLRVGHNVLYEDGVVIPMTYKEIIINRYVLDLTTLLPELKLVSNYNLSKYYTNDTYTSKSINSCFEVILKDMVELILIPTNNIAMLDDVYKKMYQVINAIYNEVIYDNLDSATSINILDLLDIQLHPELLDAMRVVNEKKDVDSINETYMILDRIIRTEPGLKNNTIAQGYISGQVNPNQIKQVLASRGYVTEIDDSIFKYPISSSFTLGMTDMYDMAIESRSGSKALYLANKAIQDSEYFARELQLVTMSVENLIHTDCGNKEYVDWYVRSGEDSINGICDLDNMVGSRYLNSEGAEEYLTKQHHHLVGTTIKLRAVMKCKLADKHSICAACFGKLSYGIHPHTNVGHIAGTTVTQKLTQRILSTKHLTSSATTGSISLDENAKKFFMVKEKDGYAFKAGIVGNGKTKLTMLITQDNAFGLKDLSNCDVSKLDPSRISRLESIVMVVEIGDVKEYMPIMIKDGNKCGSFTYKFLEYILEEGYTLDTQDRYVINLDNWKYASPIIKLPQVEFSYIALASEIKSMLKSMKMRKGTHSVETQESMLQKLFDLVNSKLDVNIALLGVIVYAFTVNSIEDDNYELGRGAPDPQLAGIKANIVNRSMGSAYAYQTVVQQIISPKSFSPKHKTNHLLDTMIKPNETIIDYYGKL